LSSFGRRESRKGEDCRERFGVSRGSLLVIIVFTRFDVDVGEVRLYLVL